MDHSQHRNMTSSAWLWRAFAACVALQVGFFLLYLVLQSVAYRGQYFVYLGANLLALSLLLSLVMALFGGLLLRRWIPDRYERRLVVTLSAFMFFGYSCVYNVVFPISLERSFSVRILINLAQAEKQQLTRYELEKRQPAEQVYGLRYDEMIGTALITIDPEGVIHLTPKGALVAKTYLAVGDMLGYHHDYRCPAMMDCATGARRETRLDAVRGAP